jgi:hypothetical protein
MQLTAAIVGLIALGANAAAISDRQTASDPTIFRYAVSHDQTCSNIIWDLVEFRVSQWPTNHCVEFKDLLGTEAPVKAVLVADTPLAGDCGGEICQPFRRNPEFVC